MLDAIMQWADNPTEWREGTNIADTYPYILENLLARYPRKVSEAAFVTMKNETGKLLVTCNFDIKRVQENLHANSEKILSRLKADLLTRLDRLENNEKRVLYIFLTDLTENEIFVSNPDENPIDTDSFKRMFARIYATEQSVSESRFLVMAQETGLLNRLLKMSKKFCFIEYVPSITIRRAKEDIVKTLEKTAFQKLPNLMKQNLNPESASILKDVFSSKGILYAPVLTVPDTLKPILGKYKGYLAFSPLIQGQVEDFFGAKPDRKEIAQVKRAETVSSILKDSLEKSIPSTLLKGDILKLESMKSKEVVRLGTAFDLQELISGSFDALEKKESQAEVVIPFDDLFSVTMVIGASRSGKTTIVRRIIEQMIPLGAKFVIVDFKGEYADFKKKFGFRSFSLKPSQENEALTLNLLNLPGYGEPKKEQENEIESQKRFVTSLISEYFFVENKPLTEQQKSLLAKMAAEELLEANPTLEGIVSRIERCSEENGKFLAELIRKNPALGRVFDNTSNAALRYIFGQNVLIDISGRGFYKQPSTSEKILICYAILKVLESSKSSSNSRSIVVLDEIASQPKDSLFNQESNTLIKSLVSKVGIIILGRALWSDLLDLTKTLIAHKQANETRSLDLVKLLPPEMKRITNHLQKIPPTIAVVRTSQYTGLVLSPSNPR